MTTGGRVSICGLTGGRPSTSGLTAMSPPGVSPSVCVKLETCVTSVSLPHEAGIGI